MGISEIKRSFLKQVEHERYLCYLVQVFVPLVFLIVVCLVSLIKFSIIEAITKVFSHGDLIIIAALFIFGVTIEFLKLKDKTQHLKEKHQLTGNGIDPHWIHRIIIEGIFLGALLIFIYAFVKSVIIFELDNLDWWRLAISFVCLLAALSYTYYQYNVKLAKIVEEAEF